MKDKKDSHLTVVKIFNAPSFDNPYLQNIAQEKINHALAILDDVAIDLIPILTNKTYASEIHMHLERLKHSSARLEMLSQSLLKLNSDIKKSIKLN